MNFTKFLGTPFSRNTSGQLFLEKTHNSQKDPADEMLSNQCGTGSFALDD